MHVALLPHLFGQTSALRWFSSCTHADRVDVAGMAPERLLRRPAGCAHVPQFGRAVHAARDEV